jgi:uncharacterized membrane protein YhaH (DUF805 family)
MGFGEAIVTCLRNYFNFSGRASRAEYWWFTLFVVLTTIGGKIIDAMTQGVADGGLFESLVALVVIVPHLAVAVRRLHDTNRSGWWWWLWFVPLIGWLVMLVWLCEAGDAEPNRYDPAVVAAV